VVVYPKSIREKSCTKSSWFHLESASIGLYRLAQAIDVPPRRINEIVHGKRAISADTALRLARFFGMTAEFWINLQTQYDLRRAKAALKTKLAKIMPMAA
jgi:antitoxin HigA-1